jgi:hypothetical protein
MLTIANRVFTMLTIANRAFAMLTIANRVFTMLTIVNRVFAMLTIANRAFTMLTIANRVYSCWPPASIIHLAAQGGVWAKREWNEQSSCARATHLCGGRFRAHERG